LRNLKDPRICGLDFIYIIDNKYLISILRNRNPAPPQPKRPEKTVDPARDWVYIHECHPFKGSFQYDLARPSAISRIKWSWGFSVDAPVRFDARREWKSWVYGFPGWHSVSMIRQKAVNRRAKVRQDFSTRHMLCASKDCEANFGRPATDFAPRLDRPRHARFRSDSNLKQGEKYHAF
jgi:hypothetical protein